MAVTSLGLWPDELGVSRLARIFSDAEQQAGVIEEGDQPLTVQPHEEYRLRPEDWIVEKIGVRRETLRWLLNDGYERCGCAICEKRDNPGPHDWDGTKEPILAILDALARGDRMIGIESGNGTGKSFLFACVILWFVACWRDARVFTFAPKEDQLSLYIWAEISRLWPRFLFHFPTAKLNHLEILIEPGNKIWGAWGYPVAVRDGEAVSAKASGMHAEHMLILTEETQGMDSRVLAANEATCTDEHNIRVALGNPGHPLDELHKFSIQPGATHIRISAEDHPNVVTGRKIVPGATSRVKVLEALTKHGRDGRFYQTRIRGLCPDGGGPALYELNRNKHLVPLDSLGLPALDSNLVTVFGWLDWGHGHPWSFGKYACWWDTAMGRERLVKLETIGGHRMRSNRIAQAIKDAFPDLDEWDYIGAGSDIKQKHVGRTPDYIVVKTLQEQLADHGVYIGTFVDDGAFSLKDRLNNFRDWIAWQGTGELDTRTMRRKDGTPAFVFADTPGNQACFEQCAQISTDEKKPEIPKRRDANAETGEGGDDMFAETMMALASRPNADEPTAADIEPHHNTGFEGKAGKRRRRARQQEDDEAESPWDFQPYGYDEDDDEDEEPSDWWSAL